jgi:hypothetical protein
LNFIDNPNLPRHRVKVALISNGAGNDVISDLYNMNIEVITVPPCIDIASPVASHPDMLFHHLGGNRIAFYRGADSSTCKILMNLGFNLLECDNVLSRRYPHDITLNAARAGNFLFCNEFYTDKVILENCKLSGLHIIPVKQGYTKCSVCVANETSIITADVGIAQAARNNGLEVLKIREGFIKLPEYNTGFIGGCCGKLDRDKMAFCGDVSIHPDFEAIKKFLSDREIEIITLGEGQLLDIGSILPIMEW